MIVAQCFGDVKIDHNKLYIISKQYGIGLGGTRINDGFTSLLTDPALVANKIRLNTSLHWAMSFILSTRI